MTITPCCAKIIPRRHTICRLGTHKKANITRSKFQVGNLCGVSLCDDLYDHSYRKVHLVMMHFSNP